MLKLLLELLFDFFIHCFIFKTLDGIGCDVGDVGDVDVGDDDSHGVILVPIPRLDDEDDDDDDDVTAAAAAAAPAAAQAGNVE